MSALERDVPLGACIGIFLSWHYHVLSVATEPGFLDFDNLPETNFSCEGKVIGGYYADTETGCQMFHVCTIGQKGEITDIKFLCLNGTVFDQETRVCERLDEVDCSKSESFYDLNLELYGNNGAGYGIQPENEDIQEDQQLCEEEDEDECKTEKPVAPSKPTPTEQVHASSEEADDEETTTQPFIPSTTSRRPVVTSTSAPSTTPAPQVLQFPSSSPETIAALLALHKAFTQSLQQHSSNKDAKVNIPKLTGFVESLDPIKATQQAETFEFDSDPPSSPPRHPNPFPTKTKFTIPQNQPKPQFPSPPKPLYQNPVKSQYQNSPPVKQEFQTPPKPQFQNSQKTQYQPQPKQSPPLQLPPVNYQKPIQTTSESYGSGPFHHSFHINSQVGHFPDPNYQDHYSDRNPQPSPQSQTEAPKQYDFDYDDDYYDEKPHSSKITPYQLHQLKVNQVKNANQANPPSSNHGSFVREVSSPAPTKAFNVPTYRSVTPSIAIITATSTTSSSSVKTSKPVQSAILPSKEIPSAAGYIDSLDHHSTSNDTHESFQDHPQSYDYYTEGDVRADPFYKDVPKIGRSKRSLDNNLVRDSSVTFLDYVSLTKLKDNLLNSVFKNNSQTILRAILQQYCNEKNDSNSSSIDYCLFANNSNISDIELGENWKVVVPKDNSDYIYLIKTIFSSNEYENSTSNILLLVNFPEEFKLLRDTILKSLNHYSTNSVKEIDLNNIDSSMHHRFKRVKRNKLIDNSLSRKSLKTSLKKMKKLKKKRKKRQTISSESDEIINVQQDNLRVGPRPRSRESSQVVVRRRPVKVLGSSSNNEEPTTLTRPRQRRPSGRSQIPQRITSESPVQYEVQDIKESQTPRSNIKTPSNDASTKVTSSTSEANQDKLLGRPTSRRRGQGVRYHFSENPQPNYSSSGDSEPSNGKEETSTVYPFNLKPGTRFSCDDKIKGGYYADVEAECYGYFICSQGEINGPLLKSHFWCGPTTKFNQRSRTCQVEANVACAVSERYFHLNKDILSLPDPDVDVKDTFEPSKVKT